MSGKSTAAERGLNNPTWEDWEAVRWLITKLWYEQDKSVDDVVSLLQDRHYLAVS